MGCFTLRIIAVWCQHHRLSNHMAHAAPPSDAVVIFYAHHARALRGQRHPRGSRTGMPTLRCTLNQTSHQHRKQSIIAIPFRHRHLSNAQPFVEKARHKIDMQGPQRTSTPMRLHRAIQRATNTHSQSDPATCSSAATACLTPRQNAACQDPCRPHTTPRGNNQTFVRTPVVFSHFPRAVGRHYNHRRSVLVTRWSGGQLLLSIQPECAPVRVPLWVWQ